jgi:uncharacterized protein (TIGR03000 family)
MYSVVMLMALSAGPEVPEFGRRNNCDGGCRGVVANCHGCYGGGGCYGDCRGRRGGLFGRWRNGCHGCYGGGCHGVVSHSCHGCHGGTAMPPADKGIPAPATLVVTLPADARLTIQGVETRSTASERTFISPALQPGQEYQYVLEATLTRHGKTEKKVEKVSVWAGRESKINIQFPTSVATR